MCVEIDFYPVSDPDCASTAYGPSWDRAGLDAGDTASLPGPTQVRALEAIQMMLEGISEHACVLNVEGTILAASKAWKQETESPDFTGLKVGGNFMAFHKERQARRNGSVLAAGFAAICDGRKQEFHCRFRSTMPRYGGYAKVHMVAFAHEGLRYVLVRQIDASESWKMRQKLRSLEIGVADARALERWHIGLALRLSTERQLAALRQSLARLNHSSDKGQMRTALVSCSRAVDLVQRKVRALSLVCHPPSLADHGFAKASNALVTGFCKRLGIEGSVDIQGPVHLVSDDKALILYRITQELLLNALHNREHNSVVLRLDVSRARVRLIVEDRGALRPGRSNGMGEGMLDLSERVEKMGGAVTVNQLRHGIRILAAMPLDQARVAGSS